MRVLKLYNGTRDGVDIKGFIMLFSIPLYGREGIFVAGIVMCEAS